MNTPPAQTLAVLTLAGTLTREVTLTLVSPRGEPEWDTTVSQAVQWALSGRPVVAVLPDPPLWDIEPQALAAPVNRLVWQGKKFILVSAPAATPQFLQALTATTDFRLQALWLWVGVPEPLANLTPFLAVLQQPYQAAPNVTAEFIECFNDGETLAWNHPDPQALGQWVAHLPAWARQHGWAFEQKL